MRRFIDITRTYFGKRPAVELLYHYINFHPLYKLISEKNDFSVINFSNKVDLDYKTQKFKILLKYYLCTYISLFLYWIADVLNIFINKKLDDIIYDFMLKIAQKLDELYMEYFGWFKFDIDDNGHIDWLVRINNNYPNVFNDKSRYSLTFLKIYENILLIVRHVFLFIFAMYIFLNFVYLKTLSDLINVFLCILCWSLLLLFRDNNMINIFCVSVSCYFLCFNERFLSIYFLGLLMCEILLFLKSQYINSKLSNAVKYHLQNWHKWDYKNLSSSIKNINKILFYNLYSNRNVKISFATMLCFVQFFIQFMD